MKTLHVFLYIVASSAVLAGCGRLRQAQDDMPPNASAVELAHGGYKVLYNFLAGGGDAYFPYGGLVAVKDKLYGTSENGGTADDGTIYEASTSGKEHLIHSFGRNPDGVFPWAPPTSLNGKLYGTTYLGGSSGNGAVYGATAGGKEWIVYSFQSGQDGGNPYGGLITNGTGNLFGTTSAGGHDGNGTVFKLTTAGKKTVLHSFGGTADYDGAYPYASPISVNGALYGTAYEGGRYGRGIVYEITKTGKYRELYSFGATSGDAAWPVAPLIYVNGAFYGTTEYGGTQSCTDGCGAVYEISGSGVEQVLYRFQGTADGKSPIGGLLFANGVLYGTTNEGGSYGLGTVFKLTTSGQETVLHSFSGVPDGANPWCALVKVAGALYGTTSKGGSGDAGTIFRIYL